MTGGMLASRPAGVPGHGPPPRQVEPETSRTSPHLGARSMREQELSVQLHYALGHAADKVLNTYAASRDCPPLSWVVRPGRAVGAPWSAAARV